MRCITWNNTTDDIQTGSGELISLWQNNPDLMIWVDLDEGITQDTHELLTDVFEIHPLAISDASRERHPPKIENFSQYWFLLLKELNSEQPHDGFRTHQFSIFASDNFIITRASANSTAINFYWDSILNKQQHDIKPSKLALLLATLVSDSYVEFLLEVEQELETLEEEMFANPRDDLLTDLISYQTGLRKLNRVLSYHTQLVTQKHLEGLAFISTEWEHEIVNLYDHTERAHSLGTLYYATASDLIDGYISVASHRLNQIMKVLTIITVIFVPLSFIAGLYGMNFENIPELKARYGYFYLLGIMFSIVFILLFIFRRKKWL